MLGGAAAMDGGFIVLGNATSPNRKSPYTRLSHMARTSLDEIYLDRAGRVVSFFTHFACALSSAAAIGTRR